MAFFFKVFKRGFSSSKQAPVNSELVLRYWKHVLQHLNANVPGLQPKISHPALKEILKTPPSIDMIHHGFKLNQGNFLPEIITQQVIRFYESLEMEQRKEFILLLVKEFGVSHEAVTLAATAFLASQSSGENHRAISKSRERLRSALVPLYMKFFAQIIMEDNGLLFLHTLRADLLNFIKTEPSEVSFSVRELDEHLKDQLQSWYSAGFLSLQQISWESPVSVIEYVQDNEAVHPVQDWKLLKKRLMGNRKCFGFFHQSLPFEPVAFIMIALMDRVPSSMTEIETTCSSSEPVAPKAAIFYSISSTQKGLSGIDMGAGLIKNVVPVLRKLYPSLDRFSTLSPIPGFQNWLKRSIETAHPELKPLLQSQRVASVSELEKQKSVLMKLAHRYIYEEKIRGRALDPVANFHLRNGASFWRLNWMADPSSRGLNQSLGLMVNYYYDLSRIGANSQAYIIDGLISTQGPSDAQQ